MDGYQGVTNVWVLKLLHLAWFYQFQESSLISRDFWFHETNFNWFRQQKVTIFTNLNIMKQQSLTYIAFSVYATLTRYVHFYTVTLLIHNYLWCLLLELLTTKSNRVFHGTFNTTGNGINKILLVSYHTYQLSCFQISKILMISVISNKMSGGVYGVLQHLVTPVLTIPNILEWLLWCNDYYI